MMLNIKFSLSGISAIILLKTTRFAREQVLKFKDLTGKYKKTKSEIKNLQITVFLSIKQRFHDMNSEFSTSTCAGD